MSTVPTVEMTSHLYRFFPDLEKKTITAPAGSVADILRAVEQLSPGFTDYVLDEHGALRRHVLISVNKSIVVDRKTLSDRVPEGGTVYIFQSLTGG